MSRRSPLPVPLHSVLAGCLLLAAVPAQATEPEDGNPPAGHSGHGEVFNEGPRQKAYLMHGCGDVHFGITCQEKITQKFFDQGIGQLHGFWHFEAERTFRQVAAREPGCAMAYWGAAMANVDNPDRAAGFIEEAVVRRAQASERERMFIDMLAKYYEVTEASAKDAVAKRKKKEKADDGKVAKRKFKKSKKDRSRELVRGYEAVLHKYDNDVEAMAFLANRLWLNRRAGLSTNSHMVIELMLRQVFAANPMHPAHHYRIHLWDREDAKRALVSARMSGQAAPGIAHQWHMSGHIFAKLHRHEDAVWQQSASARVDHAHMMRDQVMPYKIHNYGHNNEWLCRSLNHIGRPNDALALARNMVELPRHPEKNRVSSRGSISGYGTRRLIDTCRNYYLRDELRSLETQGYISGGDSERTQLAVTAELGAAYLEMGDLASGEAKIRELEAMRDRCAEREAKRKQAKAAKAAKAAKTAKMADKAGTDKKAETDKKDAKDTAVAKQPGAKAAQNRQQTNVKSVERRLEELRGLAAAFGEAGDEAGDAAREKAAKQLKSSRLAKFSLAMAHLRLGDQKKARQLIDAEAKKNPNRAEIMARQVLIQWQAEDKKAARATFDRLRTAAGRADAGVPLFRRLAPIATELGYPADWRTPREAPDDVGVRPDLARLGPFRWRPQPALAWRLPSTDGREISLRDYRGKPVLVIFYLGFGCLHCVEQLQSFHPKVEAYRKAGIEIVAIGTDTVEGMKKSLYDLAPADRFAFPMVADPEMRVFKHWRCFDDFENLPLHGTFLVDGKGMVRWSDISYEPFDKPDYLLAECKRLLAQPADSSQR